MVGEGESKESCGRLVSEMGVNPGGGGFGGRGKKGRGAGLLPKIREFNGHTIGM